MGLISRVSSRTYRRLEHKKMLLRKISQVASRRAFSAPLNFQSKRFNTNDLLTITNGLEYLGEDGEETIELAEAAKDFADNELKPFTSEWDINSTPMSAELKQKCADFGFGGMYCSEEAGGGEMSRLATSVIYESLSSGCVSTTALLSIHNMVNWMIDSFGNDEQKERFCQKLSTFESFGSYCLTEPGSGSDAASLKTTAKKSDCGKYYFLNGEKAFISNAGASDVYLIMCRTGGPGPKGITAFLVEKDFEGLSFGGLENKVGWNCQPTRAVILEDCKVPVENMLGEEGKGFTYAMKGLDGGRINIASCSLGAGYSAINHARDYSLVRNQFGKPLSANQNVQFELAEMAGQLVTSRLIVRQAALCLDNKHPTASAMCALAKMEATEKCYNATDRALQMHGGYGYLKDYPVQQNWRDCRVHMILEGTNQVMRMLVSRSVLAAADAA